MCKCINNCIPCIDDVVFFVTMCHVFFPVITFTRLFFSMVTCILRMSVLGQIKTFFFIDPLT